MPARRRVDKHAETLISGSNEKQPTQRQQPVSFWRAILTNVIVTGIVVVSALFFVWRVAPHLLDKELHYTSVVLDNANKNIQNLYEKISGVANADRQLSEVQDSTYNNALHGQLMIDTNGDEVFRQIVFRKSFIPESVEQCLRMGGGFNVHLSNKTPLNRDVPDIRDKFCLDIPPYKGPLKASVVMIYHNEALSILLRSVHSILNHTEPELLEEIILVDDGSTESYDTSMNRIQFEEYLMLLPKVRLITLPERTGIASARTRGIQEVKSDVFVVLDSHVETAPGWLSPLLQRLHEKKKLFVIPMIDTIDNKTLEFRTGGIGPTLGMLWSVTEHSYDPHEFSMSTTPDRLRYKEVPYVTTPFMSGGLFAGHKHHFLNDLGGYDSELRGWGAENIELSLRAWMCKSRLEVAMCSHVYHMFRSGGTAYKTPGVQVLGNRLRVAAGWMDEYSKLVALQLTGRSSLEQFDVSKILRLREEKKCHSFKWFLRNVWKESYVRGSGDVPYMGSMYSLSDFTGLVGDIDPNARTEMMLSEGPLTRFTYFKIPQRIVMTTNDEVCWTLDQATDKLVTSWCKDGEVAAQDQHFTVERINHPDFEAIVTRNAKKRWMTRRLFMRSDPMVLVRIKDDKKRCLTKKNGMPLFEPCAQLTDFDNTQAWIWQSFDLSTPSS